MQQIIYRNATTQTSNQTATQTVIRADRRLSLTQWIGQKWDLVGVLALMASSTAYGVLALSHLS